MRRKRDGKMDEPPSLGRGDKVVSLFQNHNHRKKEEESTMDPEILMDELSKELLATLKAMAKAKTLEEKKLYSEAVKNLTDSLGVFLRLISDVMMDYDMDEYEE